MRRMRSLVVAAASKERRPDREGQAAKRSAHRRLGQIEPGRCLGDGAHVRDRNQHAE
jgi:hypothetical protein